MKPLDYVRQPWFFRSLVNRICFVMGVGLGGFLCTAAGLKAVMIASAVALFLAPFFVWLVGPTDG